MKGLLVVLAIALAGPAGAQPRGAVDLKIALAELQRAVQRLPRGTAADRLTAASEWLDRNYSKTRPEEVTDEYARSIQRAADLLADRPTAQVVEDVTGELEAKVEHCRRLGIGMGGTIVLRVNTRRGAGTVSDWQVLYLLKIYEHVSGAAPGTFPRLSSPTDMPLEPGRYWVWARDPASGRAGPRALVRVVGEKELSVDLPIP